MHKNSQHSRESVSKNYGVFVKTLVDKVSTSWPTPPLGINQLEKEDNEEEIWQFQKRKKWESVSSSFSNKLVPCADFCH